MTVTVDTSVRAMEAARSSHHQDQDPAFPNPLEDPALEHRGDAKTATGSSTANARPLSTINLAYFEFIIQYHNNKLTFNSLILEMR